MHVNPFIAMLFYFLSVIGDNLAKAYLVTCLPMHRSILYYALTLPYVLHMVTNLAFYCAMFRNGPQFVFHRMYLPIVLSGVVLSLPVHVVPWSNQLKVLIVRVATILFTHLTAAAGGLPGEHPVEPRTSIMKPVCRAVIQTLRVTDSLTDLSLIWELVAEVWG